MPPYRLTNSFANLLFSNRYSSDWKSAINSHLSRLDPQQRTEFTSITSLAEFTHSPFFPLAGPIPPSRSQRAIQKLTDLLLPLNRFASVIDTVVQTNSGIGSPIWGPLKMICIICKEHGDLIGKIQEFVARILSSYDRIDRYAHLFERDELLQNAIGMLYSDYVDFFTRIVLFKQKSFPSQLSSLLDMPGVLIPVHRTVDNYVRRRVSTGYGSVEVP